MRRKDHLGKEGNPRLYVPLDSAFLQNDERIAAVVTSQANRGSEGGSLPARAKGVLE
jgi:hypothetical protein